MISSFARSHNSIWQIWQLHSACSWVTLHAVCLVASPNDACKYSLAPLRNAKYHFYKAPQGPLVSGMRNDGQGMQPCLVSADLCSLRWNQISLNWLVWTCPARFLNRVLWRCSFRMANTGTSQGSSWVGHINWEAPLWFWTAEPSVPHLTGHHWASVFLQNPWEGDTPVNHSGVVQRLAVCNNKYPVIRAYRSAYLYNMEFNRNINGECIVILDYV